MAIRGLRAGDADLIARALATCLDPAFFDGEEFETLFGMTRSEFGRITEHWSGAATVDADLLSAVQNALNNLLHYPHCLHDKLEEAHGIPRRDLNGVLERWLSR